MTHVAAALRVICALRSFPDDLHPEKLYGCEVWRSLDWLCDEDKVVFDVSAYPNISAALIGVFDSQITGGKRYDLAAPARGQPMPHSINTMLPILQMHCPMPWT